MNEPWSGPDRRKDERQTVEHPIHLVVAIHGFDDEEHRFEIEGITANISRGGALVRVGRPVAEGARCLIHLPESEGRVERSLIYATVQRVTPIEGMFELAIAFDTPLRSISAGESDD